MKKHSQKLIILLFLVISVPLFSLVHNTNLKKYSDTTNFSVMVAPSEILPDLKFGKMDFPVNAAGEDNENVAYENREEDYVKKGTIEDLDGYIPLAPYDEYFYVQGNEVVFRAHCAGALTSPNAYPRCEWRQRINGKDSFWNFQDQHFLSATFKVTELPNEKQEVCMLQIKGSNDLNTSSTDEVFRLEYREDSQGMHITVNEGSSESIDFEYIVGQTIDASMSVKNGKVTVKIDNKDNDAYWSRTFDSKYPYGYFKAGCYTQSSIWPGKSGVDNAEEPDAAGEVRFSKLSLTEETTPVEPSSADIWLEAECASFGSAWEEKTDNNTSNNKYLVVKTGNKSLDIPPPIGNSMVIFNLQGNFDTQKNWKLKARIRAFDESEDSFWVKINQGAWVKWFANVKTGETYKWQTLTDKNATDFVQFKLNNNQNIIEFAFREPGIRLDKILLTTQNTIDFSGPETTATNCDGGSTGNECSESINHPTGKISSGTYHANNLSSKGLVETGSSVTYKAVQEIQLTSGFYAQTGSTFIAKIESCSNTNIVAEGDYPFYQNQTNQAVNKEVPTLKLSPNPSSSIVQIDYYVPESTSVNIRIFDVKGQLINNFREKNHTIGKYNISYDISELPTGVYICTLQTSLGNISSKLIKN